MWPFHPEIDLQGGGRISLEDAERQRRTAVEILRRLESQPGLILADEVGMGKTYVALAVAVSVATSGDARGPVVVMVPPSLREKWPRELQYFKERCLGPRLQEQIREAAADSAVEFLKLVDDPRDRRASIIFVTHGAMSRGLTDRWVKLALIWRALRGRHHAETIRQRLDRGLGRILRCAGERLDEQDFWLKLLERRPSTWRDVLERWGFDPGDEPVPEAVWRTLEELPTSKTDALFQALHEVPQKRTENWYDRLDDARRVLQEELRPLWIECLSRVRHKIRLPLLILDEAHHLKNPQTRLSSLFHDPEAEADARELGGGSLAGVFERMLFLTATPFQLGHEELVSVLERFEGIAWSGRRSPAGGRHQYHEQISELRRALDDAQAAAVGLDHAWGRLRPEDLTLGEETFDDVESWWSRGFVQRSEATPAARDALDRFDVALKAMRKAEELLRPWVIRHLKPRCLPAPYEQVPRRKRSVNGVDNRGLSIPPDAILPFLLAARAACEAPESRPVFAEGLASSYEAFLQTRGRNKELAAAFDTDEDRLKFSASPANWYLARLEELVRCGEAAASELHPKVSFTVQQTVELWRRKEKVLVFCHFIITGYVLRRAISRALQRAIDELAAERLGCSPKAASGELERLGRRFFDRDAPLRRALDDEVRAMLEDHPVLVEEGRGERIMEIVRRYFRTPSFLARFFPLGSNLSPREQVNQALHTPDLSGLTPFGMIENFFNFLVEYAGRDERDRYLEALARIQVGSHRTSVARGSFLEGEIFDDEPESMLPNVRLVNGATRSETRQRLMLAFNTPFYPEVLITSSVLAEGVDLHLSCRHVIHHDLCWNPSTLEQRTGRVDRIGAKAERCGMAIEVLMPFLAETQDEKQYRVVMDRERWFQVVMGEKYTPDLLTTERLAQRVEFPAKAARMLAFRLEVREESDCPAA